MKEFKETEPQQEEDNIVELTNEEGKVLKFSHIATLDHKNRWFAFFQPAEEIDGVEENDVVIFEITGAEGDETLVPVEDQALLDEVFNHFVEEMESDEGCDCDECSDEECDCEDEHDHHCGCGCGNKHN